MIEQDLYDFSYMEDSIDFITRKDDNAKLRELGVIDRLYDLAIERIKLLECGNAVLTNDWHMDFSAASFFRSMGYEWLGAVGHTRKTYLRNSKYGTMITGDMIRVEAQIKKDGVVESIGLWSGWELDKKTLAMLPSVYGDVHFRVYMGKEKKTFNSTLDNVVRKPVVFCLVSGGMEFNLQKLGVSFIKWDVYENIARELEEEAMWDTGDEYDDSNDWYDDIWTPYGSAAHHWAETQALLDPDLDADELLSSGVFYDWC